MKYLGAECRTLGPVYVRFRVARARANEGNRR